MQIINKYKLPMLSLILLGTTTSLAWSNENFSENSKDNDFIRVSHYIKFTNYTGEASNVKYWFDGVFQGQGREGFARTLKAMEKVNKGAFVLFYPDFVFYNRRDDSGPKMMLPFDPNQLSDVVKKLGVRLIMWEGDSNEYYEPAATARDPVNADSPVKSTGTEENHEVQEGVEKK
jgi:hypothetical protein